LVVLYVAFLVGAPTAAILAGSLSHGALAFVRELIARDALHAIFLTVVLTAIAVVINAVMGLLVAYVLVRDRFPGRRLLGGLVDLPMAVSPVIAGYMLILLFGRIGWFGPLVSHLGVKIVFALPAMAMATVFVTVPFVIREVMPVLAEAGLVEEQAA